MSTVRDQRLLAVGQALGQEPDYVWRKLCRQFSAAFSTPLADVLALPESFVLQHIIEGNLDVLDEDGLMEEAQRALGVDAEEEKLIQEQVEMFEAQEERRQEKLARRRGKGWGGRPRALKKRDPAPQGDVRKVFEDQGDPDAV